MAGSKYNPYEHRLVEKPVSDLGAFSSLVKCSISSGILAMPKAFSHVGYIWGSILIIFVAVLMTYGTQLLIKGMTETCRRTEVPYSNYPDTMKYAFTNGPHCCRCLSFGSGMFTNLMLSISYYGIVVAYTVFVAKNFLYLAQPMIHCKQNTLIYFILAVGVFQLPIFLIRHLKYLVPLITLGNLLMYTGFAVVFYYLFRGLPSLNERHMFKGLSNASLFLSISLFAVCSLGEMVVIEAQMEKPQHFIGRCGILNLTMILVVMTYIAFSLLGYWRFGEALEWSITLNLPKNEIAAQYIVFSIAVSIFLSYPLTGYVAVDIILNQFLLKNREANNPHCIEYALRIVFVVVVTLHAAIFPNLSSIMAFVGAFTVSILNLIFPALIDICMCHDTSFGVLKWKLWTDIFTIFCGICIFFLGTYFAILDMISGEKNEET